MLKTMVLFAHSLSCSGFVNRFKNNNDDNKEDIPWFSLLIPGPRDLSLILVVLSLVDCRL